MKKIFCMALFFSACFAMDGLVTVDSTDDYLKFIMSDTKFEEIQAKDLIINIEKIEKDKIEKLEIVKLDAQDLIVKLSDPCKDITSAELDPSLSTASACVSAESGAAIG